MDLRTRRGNILIETILLMGFFCAMISVYELHLKEKMKNKNKYRWEKNASDSRNR
jgi:hypothetical protein